MSAERAGPRVAFVIDKYRAADVLVVASRSETFSNVLAEAMSHGLAVVTTPVGLAQHWIRHGENGIIVRGEDGREMARALHQLLSDEGLRDRLGTAARRDALPTFSADSVVERYLSRSRTPTANFWSQGTGSCRCASCGNGVACPAASAAGAPA
jgi:glycogen synthase